MASPFNGNSQSAAKFTQQNLVKYIQGIFTDLPDSRTGANIQYQMEDAALSAFAVFFMQNPSFLAQQKSLEKAKGKNNLQSLFGVHKTPCDNQIRHLLEIPPTELYPVFNYIYKGLNETGYLNGFHSVNNSLLIALDGVDYFSSTKIHCEHCSSQTSKDGKVHYSHKAITPVIVSPTENIVLPLAPEFIVPQDGHDKQDCELTASTRWIEREHRLFSGQTITILGDDLYASNSRSHPKIFIPTQQAQVIYRPDTAYPDLL
jgi:hypothetical protein